jgi:hypothetical protein
LQTALNLTTAPADEQHAGRLWFMRRLLTAMRELTGTNLDHALHANPNGRLPGLPMAQRIKWTFDTWRDSGAWNELLRLPAPASASGLDPRRDAPLALGKARHMLLHTLGRVAASAPSGWSDPLTLIQQLKRNEYQFLFERRHRNNYGGLYTSPYYGPNNPYGATFNTVKDEASGWDRVEHQFVIHVLTGPLHWMGLVDLRYAQDSERGENAAPDAYRLTESGAWLLGVGREPVFAEGGGKVIVQPNFTVLALEPISDAVLNELDQFAELQGGERAIAYQLTRESLYRGQQSNWDAARVTRFLETHQGAPIPTNVQRSLEEWESSHRRITFHRDTCMVQFADNGARDESAPALARFQPHQLGGRFELIGQASAGEVITALREAGWVPVVQSSNRAEGDGAVRASEDGEVIFVQPTPSIYTLGKLAAIAELPSPASPASLNGTSPTSPREIGNGIISPNSVRAAMSAGMPLDQLLATLAELHSGPVPEGLEQRIRAWASFYGTATLQPVMLLELSSLEVLTNLLNDREVGPHLRPIEGALTPTAVVAVELASEIKRMLSERGIQLRESEAG